MTIKRFEDKYCFVKKMDTTKKRLSNFFFELAILR